MRAQASTADPKKRKESFDRVQEIAAEQAPLIYLINQNALSAVSNRSRARTGHSESADFLERRAAYRELTSASESIDE